MKKIISMLLVLALSLALFGCGQANSGSTTAPTEPLPPLQVGYGRTDISPEPGMPLRGYGNTSNRLSDSVTEQLFTTCIAITDETGKTILLYHNDLCNTDEDVFDKIREDLSAATGVPFEQILVASTHTHSAVDISNVLAKNYTKQLYGWMLSAAEAALADRKEATIQIAEAYPQDLNWIRYYNYSDGSWGSGTLPAGAKRVSHLRETDNQLQMIRFVREDAKDVFLVNWQGHPHREGSDDATNASSDIVGVMRRVLEQRDGDVLFAYFTGASGNVNNHSMISGVTTTKDHDEHGRALVDYMVAAEFREVDIAPIQVIYHVEQVTSDDDKNRSYPFPLAVFSVGDIAFAMAPYEMFDTSGQEIKEGSPFEMTFVSTCSNASEGYLPTEEGFEADDSYEVGATRVVKGSAERMVEIYVDLLGQIYDLTNPQ